MGSIVNGIIKMLEKLCARDWIAIIVIIGGLILVGFGLDKTVGGLLVMVVSFYFGLNTPTPNQQQNGQSNSTGDSSGVGGTLAKDN